LNLFGRSQHEIHNELVDGFMETWKRKNLPNIKTISSDIEDGSPPDPIKEINEVVQNIQFPHKEQCEACYRTVCRKGLDSLSQGFKLA
jgi:hypothetical protein